MSFNFRRSHQIMLLHKMNYNLPFCVQSSLTGRISYSLKSIRQLEVLQRGVNNIRYMTQFACKNIGDVIVDSKATTKAQISFKKYILFSVKYFQLSFHSLLFNFISATFKEVFIKRDLTSRTTLVMTDDEVIITFEARQRLSMCVVILGPSTANRQRCLIILRCAENNPVFQIQFCDSFDSDKVNDLRVLRDSRIVHL